MKINEQNFISQLVQKNEKALEYCMLHYGGLVKSVLHRYLGSLPCLEEECCNDVFLAVWDHASSYQPEKNPFANWIAGVARIKALDAKRKYAKELLEVSFEDNAPPLSEFSAEIQAIQEELSAETQQMLSCLKPEDKDLFLRLYVEEETMDEVSRHTGLSKPVIYNRLSRGRSKIRRLFTNRPERS